MRDEKSFFDFVSDVILLAKELNDKWDEGSLTDYWMKNKEDIIQRLDYTTNSNSNGASARLLRSRIITDNFKDLEDYVRLYDQKIKKSQRW